MLADPSKLPKDEGEGKQFWDVVGSLAFKDTALVLLIGSVPQQDVADLTDIQCRSYLSKIQALHKLFYAPEFFVAQIKTADTIKPNPGSDPFGEQDEPKETLTED